MKIAFRFENGTSQLILTPEDQRDKTYIDLCIDGKNDIKLKPTTTDSIILEFNSIEVLQAHDSLEKLELDKRIA